MIVSAFRGGIHPTGEIIRMFGKPTRATHRRFGSQAAMAIALAAGGVLASAALTAPAYAQKKEEAKVGANSKGFAAVYDPFATIVNSANGDHAAAKAMIPSIRAAIENDIDKFTMGNALIALGTKTKDTEVQKQGLLLALESGRVSPAEVGLFNYHLGRFAYEAKNFPDARRHYQAALAAGYAQGEPEVLIAETYFQNKEHAEGLRYLAGLIEKRRAAGQQVPEAWYRRGQAIAFEAKLATEAAEYSQQLLNAYNTPDNWKRAFAVLQATPADDQASLDLLRLMRVTGALDQRQQYINYVDVATKAGLPSEVLAVLADGVSKGAFNTADGFYGEQKAMAESNAADDKVDPAKLMAEARASATGVTANGAGDLFFSLGNYADAVAMYQLAVEKGSRDRELTLTRLGIAQVLAGQYDAGKATLAQVAGPRASVARIWTAYANSKSAAGG
jgi:tetratricopeptide (TPR) repeat protein